MTNMDVYVIHMVKHKIVRIQPAKTKMTKLLLAIIAS